MKKAQHGDPVSVAFRMCSVSDGQQRDFRGMKGAEAVLREGQKGIVR